jgi:preprotein translocase subunit SecG
METILLVVHVLLGASVIGLVLIQQGKGADAGASFGGGASQTVFGSAGAGGFFGEIDGWIGGVVLCDELSLSCCGKTKSSGCWDLWFA